MIINKNQYIFESHALLLHTIIKSEIDCNNLNSFLKQLSYKLPFLIHSNNVFLGKISYASIDKVIKKIIKLDSDGVLVYSCLSISIMVHIYLCIMGIMSNIIIGSCIIDDKVFSHAWVKTEDGKLFDYRFDTYKYREIKRINLVEYKKTIL